METFIKLAENNHLDVGASDWGSARKRSRKITEFFNPKLPVKKMSKQQIVENN